VEGDAPAPATTGRGCGRGRGKGRGNSAAVALQRPARRMPTPRGRRRGTSWHRDTSAGYPKIKVFHTELISFLSNTSLCFF
jgi:hypothetical protein